MADWRDVARGDYAAARYLERGGADDPALYRAAVNRYYYAGFHLLTQRLIEAGASVRFVTPKRLTPPHTALPTLTRNDLPLSSKRRAEEVANAIFNLYGRRIGADYTTAEVDVQYCKEARRFLNIVLRQLQEEL